MCPLVGVARNQPRRPARNNKQRNSLRAKLAVNAGANCRTLASMRQRVESAAREPSRATVTQTTGAAHMRRGTLLVTNSGVDATPGHKSRKAAQPLAPC